MPEPTCDHKGKRLFGIFFIENFISVQIHPGVLAVAGNRLHMLLVSQQRPTSLFFLSCHFFFQDFAESESEITNELDTIFSCALRVGIIVFYLVVV